MELDISKNNNMKRTGHTDNYQLHNTPKFPNPFLHRVKSRFIHGENVMPCTGRNDLHSKKIQMCQVKTNDVEMKAAIM